MEELITPETELEPLKWHSEKRKLKDLIQLEKNPFGKMSAEKKRRLEKKVLELGVFEAPTINQDNVLLSFNKRHAILMENGFGETEYDVMVPNRPLTEHDQKQIVIASNVHEGSWEKGILEEEYEGVVDLVELGLDMNIEALLEEAGKSTAAEDKPEPVYPIAARYSEKYDGFVIASDNEIDTNFIKQVLQLDKVKSFKSETVGQTFVISSKDFTRIWNENQKAKQ